MKIMQNAKTLNTQDLEKFAILWAEILRDNELAQDLKIKVDTINFDKSEAFFFIKAPQIEAHNNDAQVFYEIELSGATDSRYKGIDLIRHEVILNNGRFENAERKILYSYNMIQGLKELNYVVADLKDRLDRDLLKQYQSRNLEFIVRKVENTEAVSI
jgi:hypothetical protein